MGCSTWPVYDPSRASRPDVGSTWLLAISVPCPPQGMSYQPARCGVQVDGALSRAAMSFSRCFLTAATYRCALWRVSAPVGPPLGQVDATGAGG